MSCSTTNGVRIIKEVIITGDPVPGPQGPAGPAGGVALPISSDDVLYETTSETLTEALDRIDYVVPDILTFTTPTTVFEKRPAGGGLTSMSFDWTRNKDVIAQDLSGPPELVIPTLNEIQTSVNVTLNDLVSTSTFTLTIDDGDNTNNASVNIQFLNRVIRGVAAQPGMVDSSFLSSLPFQLSSTRSFILTATAGSGEYYWAAYPTSMGLAAIYINGFLGGFQNPATVSYTNGQGFVEDYYVYQSTNSGLGTNTITVA
jgi:hypothetical protein